MQFKRKQMTCLSAGLVALAALATGGMTAGPVAGPVRMANLKIEGLQGFQVTDEQGTRIGEIIAVTADARGKARWLKVDLDAGGEARLASFRAWLDASEKTIRVQLPEDMIVRRAEPETLSSLSA